MDLQTVIKKRRAYRSLEPVNINKKLIEDLAKTAQLSASCFNNQPWQYVFVYKQPQLNNMHEALSKGNEWAKKASMIIAVLSKKEDDCVIYDRVYHHFDTGMATAFLILRATELGLVAHPIAGYSPKKTRAILNIPDEFEVITLVIVGKHANTIDSVLSEKQREAEQHRPERKPLNTFVYYNSYGTL